VHCARSSESILFVKDARRAACRLRCEVACSCAAGTNAYWHFLSKLPLQHVAVVLFDL
jgi:hypothetical protein